MSEQPTTEFENDTATAQSDKDLLTSASSSELRNTRSILAVQEINRMMDITRVPQSPGLC